MRNHKTGCGRCSRKVCCCPRPSVATSCICPPGPPGPAGPAGPAGSNGTTPLSAGGLLKFSGIAVASEAAGLVAYLADSGFLQVPALAPILDPIEYPIAADRTLVNLSAAASGPALLPGQTLDVEVLVDGSPVLTVTLTTIGIVETALGTVDVIIGQRVSLRVTASGIFAATIGLAASVGLE